METLLQRELEVVTALGEDRRGFVEATSIDRLLSVLWRRASRLVKNEETRERLRPVLEEFVGNIVEYFHASGRLDDYALTGST